MSQCMENTDKGGKKIKIINLSIATHKNACEKERFKFRNLTLANVKRTKWILVRYT